MPLSWTRALGDAIRRVCSLGEEPRALRELVQCRPHPSDSCGVGVGELGAKGREWV